MKQAQKIIKVGSLLSVLIAAVLLGLYFFETGGIFEASGRKKNALAAQTVKLLFLGDLMLDRHVGERIKEKGLDNLLGGLKQTGLDLSQYNLVNANLEGAVTDNGAHYPPEQAYDFAFAPDLIGQLKKYNFTAFNLANNHFTDQGERGVKEARANLVKLNFNYYGCADGQTGDCSAAVYETNGLKIGLAGFSQVYKKFDLDQAEKIIKVLKSRSDLTVINLHWGLEYEHNFNQAQAATARQLVDAGADIIIGHHPHVTQGLEIYKNKLIFYSLGNFIFDQYFSADTQEELAVAVDWAPGKKIKISLIPLISVRSRPTLMTGAAKDKFLNQLAGWSKGEDLKKQIKSGELIN